jgi:hypothetical protein
MSAHSGLDSESFQTLLASAFAVQESGMNKESLSAMVEIQKEIAKGELPLEKILDLIADRARAVADATGVAIGLHSGNQLVYPSGSGSGTRYVGQSVTAVLSVSAQTGPRKEILRVENAENDCRIEAAICRESDANALLMIPIYRDQFVAGVLEVLFRDAHTFDDGEMRTYRMMANLVEEAMARDLKLRQKGAQATQLTAPQPSVGKAPAQVQGFRGEGQRTSPPPVIQVCDAPATAPRTIATLGPRTQEVPRIKSPIKRAFLADPRWSFGAAALMILLGVAVWMSLHQRATFTMEGGSRMMRSKDPEKHVLKATSGLNDSSGTQNRAAARPRFRRVQVGPNEVDYVAEDVTIRRFTNPPSPRLRPGSGFKQFDVGTDVTVRLFKDKPEVAQTASPCKPRCNQ